MPNTLTEIDTRLLVNLAVPSTSTTYPQTRRYGKINSVIRRIANGKIKNILDWTLITGWDLRFLRKRVQVKDYAPLSLQDASITTWATTINTSSTTDVPTSWNGYIGWSVFAYTGKTATSLTWVTLLEGTHEKNALITIVTKIPTNCLVPSELYRVDRKWALQPTDYIDYKSQDYSESYRTIIGDSTATDQYILPQFQSNQETYRFYYYSKPTTLASGATETELPDDYGVELVSLLASWELLRETEKRDQGKNQLVLAYAMLIEFYEKFIEQKKSTRKVVRQKPSRHGFVYHRRYS